MIEVVYLDNAATTPVLAEVVKCMQQSLKAHFGNPSSNHQIGRKARALVESARKNIAKQFNVSAGEIVFTSGGSEADNLILKNAVIKLGVQTIISSVLEHHAVLHTLEYLKANYGVELKWVDLKDDGSVDYEHFESLLKNSTGKKLVSLMYINNEIGNILDLDRVATLCKDYEALFHSDAVQGIGHFEMDMTKTPIDFFAASAHKFHGPKGVGFAYINKKFSMDPLLHGGEQERGSRAGTENVHSILGMEKALEIACINMKEDAKEIQKVKTYLINALKINFPGIAFNGCSEDSSKSSYVILNARFPKDIKMLLFNLDIKGIAASGGSACQSGSNKGSHVLSALLNDVENKKSSIRFSFSKLNTIAEIDRLIAVLKEIIN